MFVSCECGVSSCKGLCYGPIPRTEESYRVCVCVCVRACLCVCVSLRVTRRNSKPSSPAMSRWKMVGQRKEERKKERKSGYVTRKI